LTQEESGMATSPGHERPYVSTYPSGIRTIDARTVTRPRPVRTTQPTTLHDGLPAHQRHVLTKEIFHKIKTNTSAHERHEERTARRKTAARRRRTGAYVVAYVSGEFARERRPKVLDD